MNLYTLHDHPESIHGHDKKDTRVPELIWAKYKKDPASMKKYESVLAKDPYYACFYATDILHGRFPLGEKAIATNAPQSFTYARDALHGPFKLGEDMISKSPLYAFMYAEEVLKHKWLKGEPAIAKSAVCAYEYATRILKKAFPAGEASFEDSPYYKLRYNEFLEGLK